MQIDEDKMTEEIDGCLEAIISDIDNSTEPSVRELVWEEVFGKELLLDVDEAEASKMFDKILKVRIDKLITALKKM